MAFSYPALPKSLFQNPPISDGIYDHDLVASSLQVKQSPQLSRSFWDAQCQRTAGQQMNYKQN